MIDRLVRSSAVLRHGRRVTTVVLVLMLLLSGAVVVVDRIDGGRGDDVPVLAHYMPWFETPRTLGDGSWGWHWTMDTRDPNTVRPDGTRQIASHFDPLIGPYDSSDPAVLRYHLLLMKYAGIDGVLIDWYGTSGSNGDVAMLQRNTEDLIAQASIVGLKYAVVYEDRFARGRADVRAALRFARDHWFPRRGYLRLASTDRPYLGVFGPIGLRDPILWQKLIGSVGPVDLRTLWNNDGAGDAADGQFAWPYASSSGPGWRERLQTYYALSCVIDRRVTAVVFPGFDDFYAEGVRGGRSLFDIPYDRGATLQGTLDMARTGRCIDSVQLATWNDFGEGTMVEPTTQRGFASLAAVQRFTRVGYDEGDLRAVLRWYRAAADRGVEDPAVAQGFKDLVRGRPQDARRALAKS